MSKEIKYYTGVGARKTPLLYLVLMSLLAKELKKTHILRSGEAAGADYAFSYGADNEGELFLPEKGFRGSSSNYYLHNMNPKIVNKAISILRQDSIMPWYDRLKDSHKRLHVRNVFQILGPELNVDDKSSFMVCYTENGETQISDCNRNTGGTGTAIKLADLYSVPIYNISNKESFDRIFNMVKKNNFNYLNDARNIMWDWLKINSKITNNFDKNMVDFTIDDAKEIIKILGEK